MIKNDWTVIYTDCSTNFADNVAITDENFNTALNVAIKALNCELVRV